MSNEVPCRKCKLLVIAISNYDGEASLDGVEAGLELLRKSRFYQQDCEVIECINSAATELGIVEQIKAWIGRMEGSGPEQVHTCIFLGHGVNVHGLSCMVTVDKKLIPIWDLYNHLCQKHSLSVALFFDCCQCPPDGVLSEPNRGLFRYEAARAGWCDRSQIRLSISSSPGQYAEDASVARRYSSYISELVQSLDGCDWWEEVFHCVSMAVDATGSQTPFCVGHAIWQRIQRSSPRELSFDSSELGAMSNEVQCRNLPEQAFSRSPQALMEATNS
ncbi:unnamed protein product [Symbiodinium natans]|uniref:Uncharacterized protein n=1 Tax=Symbiodinium natans TaxID=878477 RepID=A0A812I7N5_9DINO|nr:unnamed protein product [Symbiodinium natans]